ncbi:hypothetical protein [Mesobacillus harenae]|uniref:hypothetical protein n=1 Tax=Mesobacillus harenae TaxID=2213203 RepID=UPI0015811CB9|nr:hypothetical protein [Mesobacillus harenae]
MSLKVIQFIVFLLPWASLFFTSQKVIRRFMPVTILTAFLMTIIFLFAYSYEWWVIEKYIIPWGNIIDVSFAYGLFGVGTFWIFRFTYDKFLLYAFVNLLMDAFMCFVGLPLLGKLGIAHYKNLEPWQYFLIIYTLSFVIYAYHKWQEKIFVEG